MCGVKSNSNLKAFELDDKTKVKNMILNILSGEYLRLSEGVQSYKTQIRINRLLMIYQMLIENQF